MVLVTEAWVVSIFGWAWLTVQDLWMPSLLASFVFYGFLLITTCHLVVCAFAPDNHAPRVAYFNMVVAITLFCASSVADTFHLGALGSTPPPQPTKPWYCCTNCDFPRHNRALFFSDTPLYLAEAGVIGGYLIVHLIMAGAQMLADPASRSIWGGGGWSMAFTMLLACRFVVLFNSNTSHMIPATVFYLLVFSQPLLSMSTLYWLCMCVLMVLLLCDGIPTLNITGVRVVRSVSFGIVSVFVGLSAVELWLSGTLTPPLMVSLSIAWAGNGLALVEAFLAQARPWPPSSDTSGYYPYNARPIPAPRGLIHSRDSVAVRVNSVPPPVQRLTRDVIPVPIQMQPGKKGV